MPKSILKTRTEKEKTNGKKSVFIWLDSGLKDWLDNHCVAERRTLGGTISLLIERERTRLKRK